MSGMQTERLLLDWLTADRPALDPTVVDAALASARSQRQRRGLVALLVGPGAWPARAGFGLTRFPAAARIAIVAVLTAAMLGGAALLAGNLLELGPLAVPTPPPTPIPTAIASPARTPVPTPHPLLEDLGPQRAEDISAYNAVRLDDGRVLIAGGDDSTNGQRTIARAWIFDPATMAITETGAMNDRRARPLLATLADGRVLVVGGELHDGSTEPVVSAELFDPATGRFTRSLDTPLSRMHCPCGALDRAWAAPHVVRLDDGRILITGGQLDGITGGTAELYDPETDHFSRLDVGCDATRGIQVLLETGEVLVTCLAARDNPSPPAAARFDPITSTFSAVGSPTTIGNDTATRLPGGRVLITGTAVDGDRGADLFDPELGTFTTVPLPNLMDGALPGFDSGDGRIVFVGIGDPELGTTQLRVLDPATFTLQDIDLPGLEYPDAAVQLLDGRIALLTYQLHVRLINPEALP